MEGGRYKGKRFAGFLFSAGLLGAGFFFGDPAVFAAYSMSLTGLYGLYLGGQTVTDHRQAQSS